MSVKIKKYFLPLLLVALASVAEIIGIFLCGRMIPDYKGEVFTEEKNSVTQLMFVDDEDNSRFYPWLSYDEEACVTVEAYLKGKYRDENLINEILGVDERIDDIDDISEKFYASDIESFNDMIVFIIYVFDGKGAVRADTDFTKSAIYNEENDLMYIKDFECSGSNGEKKLLDLVMTVGDTNIYYYRLHSNDANKASAPDISQKSKKLAQDLDYVVENFSKYFYESEVTEFYDGNAETENDNASEIEINIEGNDILDYIYRRYSDYELGKIEYYSEDGIGYYHLFSEELNGASVVLMIPLYIAHEQYSIFSYGDELMIVFNDSGSARENSNTILYYSISEERVTGFSIGTA